MGEHISWSSDGSWRSSPDETDVRPRSSGLHVRARRYAHVQIDIVYSQIHIDRSHPLVTPTALPSKPEGRTRWRAIVRFVRRNRSAIDLPRDSLRHALKIYLSFVRQNWSNLPVNFIVLTARSTDTVAELKFGWISIQRLFMLALHVW